MAAHHTTEVRTGPEAEHALLDLIKDIRFGMFTTRGATGELRAHPMTSQMREGDADHLWFFMSRGAQAFKDLAVNPAVGISFAHPGKDRYVSVSGNARVVNDLAIVKELWSPMVQAWFPEGEQDPDLALVAVDIGTAHYWDVDDSKITQLFKMAKAAITGNRPSHLGTTGKV